MNKVMVDNWFMDEVLDSLHGKPVCQSKAYAELLMSLVLWDEVCFPENKYNWWNCIDSQVQGKLRPIKDFDQAWLSESIVRYLRNKNVSEEDMSWYKWHNISDADEIIGSGAIRYLMLSSENDCDYLPCSSRREFLAQYLNSGKFDSLLERMERVKATERDIKSYVGEIKSLNPCIEVPSLASYIIDHAAERNMTPVDFALRLRRKKPIIRYRQYLHDVTNALETGARNRYEELCRYSGEIVKDLLSLDSKERIFTMGFKLLPFPHLYSKFSCPSSSVEVSPIELEASVRVNPCKIQLVFVKDLAQYAERKKKQSSPS